MAIREILLLGHPKLYEVCEPVEPGEVDLLGPIIQDLHDTLLDFRQKYGAGRAIAAPQIGVMKRLVYLCIETPIVFINPALDQFSAEVITLWDDCMSFPDLLVKVKRHQRCRIRYRDLAWQAQSMVLEDDLSELLKHECDHLDGILAVARAVDQHSFGLRSQRDRLTL